MAVERGGRAGAFPYYGASGVIDYIDEFLFEEDLLLVSEDGANLLNRSTPIAFVARGKYWVNNHAHVLRPRDGCLDYWAARLESIDLAPFVTGAAQPKLTIESLMNIPVAVPPTVSERVAIQCSIAVKARPIDKLIGSTMRSIGLLRERRAALITAAVTGQIDVRAEVPAEEPEPA
jgi:type I restriction enzyme S subunit